MGTTMSTSSRSGPQRLGKYELHQRLGRGGMAEVWKAFDTQLQRYVALKILHDIKPANILLDKRNTKHNPMGEPILTDFGIAKLMGVTSGTLSGMWLGTPLYISPEQAQGHPGNERSDIYSLGVILYEICAGVSPFIGVSIQAIMMQHINSMPISPYLVIATI